MILLKVHNLTRTSSSAYRESVMITLYKHIRIRIITRDKNFNVMIAFYKNLMIMITSDKNFSVMRTRDERIGTVRVYG